MALFNLPKNKNSRSNDSKAVSKSSSIKSNKTITIKGGGTLADKIQSISVLVESKLGKYKKDYDVIRDEPEKLKQYINACIENNIVAIDTETTGLDPMQDDIVGFSLYTPGQKAVYVPLNHISYITQIKSNNQINIDVVTEQFQRLVDNNIRIIMFNAPFDIRVIWSHIKVRLHCWFDCYIAARCLNENEPANGLKALHKKYVEDDTGTAWSFSKLFDTIPFSLVPIKDGYIYAARDALVTYELFEYQLPFLELENEKCKLHQLEGVSNIFWNIEMKSMDAFIDMEQLGISLDFDYCERLSNKYHKLVDVSKSNIDKILKEYRPKIDDYRRSHPNSGLDNPINIASTKQLSCLLYDILGVKVVDERNPRGVGKEILEQIKLPLCKAILEQRKLEKLLSTYIDKMPEIANPNDKRVHCKFNQYGADCIVGNSIIPTPNGYYTMSELCKSAEQNIGKHNEVNNLFIYNCDKQLEKVDSVITYKNFATIKITTEYGFSIEGTYNHPIMVSSVTKDSLKRNSSNKVYREFWNNRYFKNLEDIQIGDIVEIPCYYEYNNKNYQETNIIDNIKLSIMSEELALLLGMYHADGCAREHFNQYEIRMCNNDIDVRNQFKTLIKSLFDISVSYNEDKRDNYNTGTSHCISDKLYCLDKYLSKGAKNKSIPNIIWKSPKSVINSYIKGMTLDSSVYLNNYSNPQMLLNVMKEEDARFIQQYLISLGIITSLMTKQSKDRAYNFYRLKFSTEDYIKFRDLIGFVESKKMIFNVDNTKFGLKRRIINGSLKATVKKIEYNHNDVYDFHIAETHSFISNGFISHNTGRTSSNDPNMQNIPSRPWKLVDGTKVDAGHDVRQMFCASPGNILISCDYSAQEPRVTAHLSKDEKMINAYLAGKDVYSEIAAIAFNKTYEECLEFVLDENGNKTDVTNVEGKGRRTQAKSIVLGKLLICPSI